MMVAVSLEEGTLSVGRCMFCFGVYARKEHLHRCHLQCTPALSAAGVDDVDSYEELCSFIQTVSEGSGVTHFIMHARKCLLNGLTPLQNRTIPPLK